MRVWAPNYAVLPSRILCCGSFSGTLNKIRRVIAETREALKQTNKIEFIRFNKTRESKKEYIPSVKRPPRDSTLPSSYVIKLYTIFSLAFFSLPWRCNQPCGRARVFSTMRTYYVYPSSWFTFLQYQIRCDAFALMMQKRRRRTTVVR